MNSIGSLQGKNILFLQGPMGNFFKKIDKSFRKKGATTYKIGFNKGDEFYASKSNYTAFKDTHKKWGDFIEDFLLENKIDKIFLFGDCRFYQSIARGVADNLGIEVYVFEEGYVRPHYITLEKYGVNGYSLLPKEAIFYSQLPLKKIEICPIHAKTSKSKMIKSAIIYYAISNLFSKQYPYYIHHREFSAMKEFFYGVRDMLRKSIYFFTERNFSEIIQQNLSKKYYFVPLQTHNDFQILKHSNYKSIEKFIIEVLESFSVYAPKNTTIIFKHHPVDRGRKNYNQFIEEQARLLNIETRVFSIHDVHLPTCIKHAKATITVNSTVGLTSVGYGIPTFVMGNAVYDIEGLTNKGKSLDTFWDDYEKPDEVLFRKFRDYLIETTQLNGSFYGIIPKALS